jgi:hypothetical protein
MNESIRVPEFDAKQEKPSSGLFKNYINGYGLVVIRNAFNKDNLLPFIESVTDYYQSLMNEVNKGKTPQLPDYFRYKKTTMSSILMALDPDTRDEYKLATETTGNWSQDLESNTMFAQEIRHSTVWPMISGVVGEKPIVQGSRVRLLPNSTNVDEGAQKGVAFHQEKWPLRNQDVPLGHNLWALLNDGGSVANEDVPGIQFILGDTDFWRQPIPESEDIYIKKFRSKLLRLNGLCRRSSANNDELIKIEDTWVYKPKLKLGDIVFFDHHIPHGSFIPASSIKTRISCELRYFPPDKNFSGLALGY